MNEDNDIMICISEIISCGDKLYYDINPDSKMDVPSFFYERLEKEWVKYKLSGSIDTFYEYCKTQLIKQID